MIVRLATLILVLASARSAFAGIELIEMQMSASQLAGVVTDSTGAAVEGVEMELHTCQARKDGSMHMDDAVLARIKSDAKGKFEMPRSLRAASACLRLRAYGFNPMLIAIKWRHFGPAMKITLNVAT